MKNRTNIDFTKHELTVKKFDGVSIYELKIHDSSYHKVVFINTCGVMSVTGDLGNWIFCREFNPEYEKNGVSDGYFDEKLEIHSKQESHVFDSDKTLKAIQEFKDSFEEQYEREMTDEEVDWIERLENHVDNEFYYTYIAYTQNPIDIDYEKIPFEKKRHYRLDAIYDAFETVCEFFKNENN